MDNIVIPRSHFLLIVLIFSTFSFYHQFKDDIDKLFNKEKNAKVPEPKREISTRDILNARDRRVIVDPAAPPERRLPIHQYPRRDIKNLINIPTRGHPDQFQMVGIISRESDEKIMQLYGRQKYPGSQQWDYFVAGKDGSGLASKIPLDLTNDKELYDDDEITIPQLDASKGVFKVTIYDYDAPRYNPYVV